MNLKQCIFPIYSRGTIVGQGFLADGYFITAAHLVYDFPSCFTVLNNYRFDLSKELPIFIGEGNINYDAQMIDVVLFQVDWIESPLHIAEYVPQKDDELESYCINEVMDLSSPNPSHQLTIEPATPTGEENGNYFYCYCKRFGGSSGSPILKDNAVVGIMHGGNNEGLCSFLKMEPVFYQLGEYFFYNVNDTLDNSNEFQPNPTPDFRTAFEWYKKAANLNYLDAMYNVAYCYERGKGVEKNFEKAIAWYTKSASQGHVESQYTLGKHYLTGDIVFVDYEKAIYWLRLAAEKKHTKSLYELGLCSFKGLGFAKSYKNAIDWFRLADESGSGNVNQDVYYYLGLCYLNNKDNPLSYEVAVNYFQKAGEKNEALYYLGLCHSNGWGVQKDNEKAFELFKKAAESFGKLTYKACYEVGMCYYKGNGVERDFEEAVRWYNKAFDCDEATFQLGMCYYKGKGVEICYNEALRYFLKVANKGDKIAQKMAAGLYRCLGEGYKDIKKIEKAIEWYSKCLNKENAEYFFAMGHCYETMGSIGYHDKYKEAIEWYKKGWDQGDTETFSFISDCYEILFKLGHKELFKEAILWYKQVWNQGNLKALRYVGNCYEEMFTEGYIDNIDEALLWYKKAAEFNDYKACMSISNIYKRGIGVPVNEAESEKWDALAIRYNSSPKEFELIINRYSQFIQ